MDEEEQQQQKIDEEQRMIEVLSVLTVARFRALTDAEVLILASEVGLAGEFKQLTLTRRAA